MQPKLISVSLKCVTTTYCREAWFMQTLLSVQIKDKEA